MLNFNSSAICILHADQDICTRTETNIIAWVPAFYTLIRSCPHTETVANTIASISAFYMLMLTQAPIQTVANTIAWVPTFYTLIRT